MKRIYALLFATISVLAIASCGNNAAPGADTANTAKAAPQGENIYKSSCISCHQANGEGIPGSFPPLAKADYLADHEKAITMVVKGSTSEINVNGTKYSVMMPSQRLSDDEVAAVLTYVYTNFGNTGAVITPEQVKEVRAKY
jgi:nitrite reductase (NO-forming)